jgi:tetratricopeptide (TPR) repeat protein
MRTLAMSILALVPNIAAAQWIAPVDPSDADREEASARFASGIADLERRRWDDALEAFEHAYSLAGSPEALLGVARALRERGEHDRADRALDQILRTSVDEALRRDAHELRSPRVSSGPIDAIPWIIAGVITFVAAVIVIGVAVWEATALQPMSGAVLRL